jgi:hypothetical protein
MVNPESADQGFDDAQFSKAKEVERYEFFIGALRDQVASRIPIKLNLSTS